MKQTPLYDAVRGCRAKGRVSMHVPGHKCADGAVPEDLISLDWTEVPDTDSLYEAAGAILQAEQAAARYYGTHRTLFSAGGCTLCIQAMLRLAAPDGGCIIAHRMLHCSAVNAMALLGIEPVWVLPHQDAGSFLPGRVWASDIEALLQKYPQAKAVYLTSPDYYGVVSDIAAIAQVCSRHGVPLLVDNAHGAHLKALSMHPVMQGASMTACSAHKTLPVLTGGAFLNIADSRFAAGAKDAMALFGSTSPSYPVMMSLDTGRAWLEEYGEPAYAGLRETVQGICSLAVGRGMQVPQGPMDPTRISLNTAAIGWSGTQAAEWFRQNGIEPEYADGAYLVMVPSPFNTEEDFARVKQAVRSLPARAPLPVESALPPLPKKAMPLRQALLSPAETVPVKAAVGRIASQSVCPCPPGIPIVMPGEIVSPESAGFLESYGFFALKVVKC